MTPSIESNKQLSETYKSIYDWNETYELIFDRNETEIRFRTIISTLDQLAKFFVRFWDKNYKNTQIHQPVALCDAADAHNV